MTNGRCGMTNGRREEVRDEAAVSSRLNRGGWRRKETPCEPVPLPSSRSRSSSPSRVTRARPRRRPPARSRRRARPLRRRPRRHRRRPLPRPSRALRSTKRTRFYDEVAGLSRMDLLELSAAGVTIERDGQGDQGLSRGRVRRRARRRWRAHRRAPLRRLRQGRQGQEAQGWGRGCRVQVRGHRARRRLHGGRALRSQVR